MLFNNPKKAVYAIAIFLLLLLIAFATTCRSADLSFEAGRTVIHGEAPSIALSTSFGYQYDVSIDHQDFNYECGLFLNGSNGPNPNNIGAQCMVVDGFGRFDLGFGAAYLQNTDQWSGSHLNFALLARWRFNEHWTLTLDNHVSNAGTKMPNAGRDMIRLRYTF